MKEQSKVDKVTNGLTNVLFAIYLIALYWILLLKLGVRFSYMRNQSVNLEPFSGPPFLDSQNVMNAVIFIPLGIYAAILFRRWMVGGKLLFVCALSVLVEALQYILRIGAFDVTDVITNTSGGVIGLIIHLAVEKAFNDHIKAQKFINKFAATGTVLMIVLLVLLKMNMLPIKYR